eukprot:TRINITY_DN3277_c0_g1_i4.p1 TRINITY_DN3277_c0_g1~~TRINITY_DN3277_c0_g1_i4.p1  ORF type:complete len:238 (+),score=51.03 TRINITY_DN3277_c0_g1_i4:248-961(+)
METTSVKPIGLKLLDRALLPSDIVAYADNVTGQTGTVIAVREECDLVFETNEKLTNIPTQYLKDIYPFSNQAIVVMGQWIGQVSEYYTDATVLFEDGSQCIVRDAKVPRILPYKDEDSDDPISYEQEMTFYPSQWVKVTTKALLESKWLQGTYKRQSVGVIVHIETVLVDVDWISNFGSNPPSIGPYKPQDLKLIDHFRHLYWQVGDRCLVPPELRIMKNAQLYSCLLYTSPSPRDA